jgi:hypothetical protein
LGENIYLDLTREFNDGAVRAVLSSGQAVVLHRLAVMSKDGDWILREDPSALDHVRGVLGRRGARYRFGAPLDVRWLAGGWSTHLEFRVGDLRVRTDFVTRPPRLGADDLARIWAGAAAADVPFLDAPDLARVKRTDREKDYAVIGELARIMKSPEDRLRHSRSARDLVDLGRAHPELVTRLGAERPLLALLGAGRDAIETALDAERRAFMRANEARLRRFERAAEAWAAAWPAVSRATASLPLGEAHREVVRRALGTLPFEVAEGGDS